jgi:hypothetical protein
MAAEGPPKVHPPCYYIGRRWPSRGIESNMTVRIFRTLSVPGVLLLLSLGASVSAQQVSGQDLDKILERADRLLEEAKAAYETGRSQNSVPAFVDAGFKLEEARIKYLVLQEVGSPEKQKIATDRIRAANQLTKLIHDGKVAVSGTPADAPVPKPADASPATEPDSAPKTPLSPPAVIDVTKRSPVPDLAAQKEAEKLIRDLFKDLYSRKAPADRLLLARALLDQASKLGDDPSSAWVLYREAQENAEQVCEIQLTMDAVDRMARLFDVDGLALKSAALSAAGKNAKTAADSSALAEATLRLLEEQISLDQYEAAEKSAATAVLHARKANEPGLLQRATTRSKEMAEAKARFQAMKGVLQTLAKSPDDLSANNDMGQFLCFVKGNWELGTRFLAKGSDPVLKDLALKELSAQVLEMVGIADGWWDLADREKSPLRKGQMLAHAAELYEGALPSATGLVRIKIEKRLSEGVSRQGVPRTGAIDLLSLIDPRIDAVKGTFLFEGKVLVMVGGDFDRLQIPYAPPDEYDLRLIAERKTGTGNINIGLVSGGHQFLVMIDADGGGTTGLDFIDNKPFFSNETTLRERLWLPGKPMTLECSVRKTGVTVTLDGRRIINWKGKPSQLSLFNGWKLPLLDSMMIGTWNSTFHASQMLLTPVSGQGKKLR